MTRVYSGYLIDTTSISDLMMYKNSRRALGARLLFIDKCERFNYIPARLDIRSGVRAYS